MTVSKNIYRNILLVVTFNTESKYLSNNLTYKYKQARRSTEKDKVLTLVCIACLLMSSLLFNWVLEPFSQSQCRQT